MKRQYIRLFSFLIGLTFIISGLLFTIVNDYKKEKQKIIQEEIVIADEIEDVYEVFYNKEKDLSLYRDDLIKDIMDFSAFFSEMPKEYKKIIPEIEEYETMISEVEDISSYLQSKCNKRYSVLKANDKCDAYFINLEKTINIFVGDISFFNSKIDDYNEWIKEENESVLVTEKYKELAKYDVKKYKDNVDLNKDGTYLGMKSE